MRPAGATKVARSRFHRASAVVLLAVLLSGCTQDPTSGSASSPPSDSSRDAAGRATPDRPDVLAVSVDGLNPHALEVLGRKGAPTLHRLIDEGVSTLDARTQHDWTTTLPNHTGMLTGRWVDPSTGGHGVTINSPTSQSVHDYAGEYVASVFDAVHDASGSTALFSSKVKFDIFDRSWSDGARDVTGEDDGRDKIDTFVIIEDNDRLVDEVVGDLSGQRRALTFLHLSAPDKAGHTSGFMGQEYLGAVAETDARLGRLFDAVRSLQRDRPMVIVLTADHGGERGHGREEDPDNFTVPFVVWGSGVPGGRDLYDLNPDRSEPGDGRIPEQAADQPVRNADLANLVTSLMGIDPVRGSQFGVKKPLAVR